MMVNAMDNNTVALLNKTNELLDRWGVHPCDVVVTASYDERQGTTLYFETPPPSPDSEARFFRMISALGLSETNLKLIGDDRVLYDALQRAIDLAPRARSR
jgi:hypothetical protein